FLDIDAFLKFMAVTAVVANLDSFFTLGHNYCLYLHPETKRFHFVPWDVDLSMGNIGWFGNADQQMDLSLTKPYSQSRLADRLMANKEIADRYQAILKDLMPRCFNKEKLLAEIDAIEKTVKPLMAAEQKSMSARKESSAPPAFGALPPPDMRKFLEKRSASIEAQLSGKSKGYVPVAFGAPPPPARPLPGDILPPNAQLQLQMTEAQKKELAELQKRVDADLEKILTPEQRLQLKRLREGGGTGGFGPPKMP
ncbi:MAG: CotH kinase family protein, partial [Gemmata sp.]